jgi:hypothetical protein
LAYFTIIAVTTPPIVAPIPEEKEASRKSQASLYTRQNFFPVFKGDKPS